MTGTVAGALEARGISAAPDKLQLEAEGKIEEVEGKMILTQVSLRYRLKIPQGKRVSVEKALEHHDSFCAVSESIRRGIVVEWKGEIEEDPAGAYQATAPDPESPVRSSKKNRVCGFQ